MDRIRKIIRCMQYSLQVATEQHALSISFYFPIRYKADKKNQQSFFKNGSKQVPLGQGILQCRILFLQVFYANHMRSSSTTYLTALAFADSLYLVCACVFYSPRCITWLSTNKDPDFKVGMILKKTQ